MIGVNGVSGDEHVSRSEFVSAWAVTRRNSVKAMSLALGITLRLALVTKSRYACAVVLRTTDKAGTAGETGTLQAPGRRQIQRCMRCPAQNEREVHSWSAWEYRESHLSGVAGQYCEGIRSCTRCGITETSQIGHDWSVWEYETPCSCNLVRHCARCAYRQSRNAEAAEHDWGPWTANSDRECYSRVRVCRHCGRREERREQEPVHQWGEWQIIVPGQLLRRRVCRNCGFREDRSD